MNVSKSLFTTTLLLSFLTILIFPPNKAFAQAEGWAEEIYVDQQTDLNNRVMLPAVAADGDHIYVAYIRNTLMFTASHDRGKTWTEPIAIGEKYRDCSAPAIAAVGDKVVIAWPAKIEMEGLVAYQMFATESSNQGESWSTPRRIHSSRDDTFAPRFLVLGGMAKLLWIETPLSETLGKLKAGGAIDYTPETVEELINTRITQDSLIERMRNFRSRFNVCTYNPRSESFSSPTAIDTLSSQRIPNLFGFYGPLNGAIYVYANANTEIKLYKSEDEGAEWDSSYDNREYFSHRKLMDTLIVDEEWYSVWIDHKPFEPVVVHFSEGLENLKDKELSHAHNVRAQPRMAYSDGDFHVVWEAGETENSWITYMRTDTVPPTSEIIRPATSDIKTSEVTFEWKGEDNISATDRLVYSYTYGDQSWSSLQKETSTTIKTPEDGEYEFKVRAEDVAGNIQDPPTSFEFNTFKAAPKTIITDAPPSDEPLKTREVTVRFTGEDNSDDMSSLLYSAQVNDEEWTEFAEGTEHTFTGLSNGTHTLRIRLMDSQGNIDPNPAETTVQIEIDLELILQATPEKYTNSEQLAFDWEAKDDEGNPVNLQYYYQLNGGEVKQIGEEGLELPELEDGKHEITLWGEDESGDQSNKVTYSWVVDRQPPKTHASFAEDYVSNLPLIKLQADDQAVIEGVSTPTPTTFEYRINDGEWVSFNHEGSTWPAEKRLPFYSWGYILQIRAIDAAGNVDPNPATVDLRIFKRTNPYVLYGVIGVVVLLLLFLLKMILGKLFSGRPSKMSTASTTEPSPLESMDTSSSLGGLDDDTTPSLDLDDEEEEKKKDDDPFA